SLLIYQDLSSTESGTWQAIESLKQRLLFKEIEHVAATARNFKETTRSIIHFILADLLDIAEGAEVRRRCR
ncbi:hypothetical protein Tco_0422938, partial [Tanacetum coccineum]